MPLPSALTGRRLLLLIASAALLVAVSASVSVALLSQSSSAATLDRVLRRFPGGWIQLVALLWPLGLSFGSRRPASEGGVSVGWLLVSWGCLLGAAILGVMGGAGLAAMSVPVVPGPRAVAAGAALAVNLTVLYWLAGALVLGTRRPWVWLVGIALALVTNYWAARGLGLAPAAALHEWNAVGDLGFGTFMETPAIAGGLVLESEWESLNPWEPLLFWLGIATFAVTLAVWRRRATGLDRASSSV